MQARIDTDYLAWALEEFSGYIAADELYEGRYCVLSIVDNRNYKRIAYQVLDHDPTQDDIRQFFARFQDELKARGLQLRGITTDGSALYPTPIAEVFGDIAHQICKFHVLKELTRAVLRAVATIRKELSARKPKLGRGRPASAQARRQARHKQRIERKVSDLFKHRYLFVQRHLSAGERKTLERITRGLPQLRRLRQIMDQVYRLFDRRCRTATAVAKLKKLRRRVARFHTLGKTLRKLFSGNVEKALTFLDERLLPATSNAVERGYRRHRKMQNSVYRVRTFANLVARIALDMFRDTYGARRTFTLQTLHQARAR
jgi:hypothetical protein